MANTDKYMTLPSTDRYTSELSTGSTAWGYGDWYRLEQELKTDINISGLQFQWTYIPAVDTTIEAIFDIYYGGLGSTPSAKIQFPHSIRSDTAVGFYLSNTLNQSMFLPEPVTVTSGSAIYVRAACSAGAVRFNAIRLLHQSATGLSISGGGTMSNNYQRYSGPNPSGVHNG